VARLESKVGIVGGGIAGLSAAHELHKRGIPFVLLEASSRWGGVIRTEAAGGFLFEAGPDSLLAQKPEALALCRELGLGERLIPTNSEERTVYVLHRGRLRALPEGMMLSVPTKFGPLFGSSLLSWRGKVRAAFELVVSARRDPSDESIASFIRRRFGEEVLERIADPLLGGIHAGDPERLSMSATFPSFLDLEKRYGSLIRGMWAHRPGTSSGARPSAFYSLAGGLGEMVDALVASLPAESLKKGMPVRGLTREGERFVLRCDDVEVLVQTLVVAIPAPQGVALLGPLVPDIGELLGAIPFASTATVLLGYRREDVEHPLDGYGLMIPRSEGLRMSACSFFSTKFPGRAPEGHVLLRGFLGGTRDPEVLKLDHEELVSLVRREMKTPLGLTGEPVLSCVYRWPSATPQMELGHLDRVAEMERRLVLWPGLFLTGAGIRSTGIPDTVADATKTAARAADLVDRGAQ